MFSENIELSFNSLILASSELFSLDGIASQCFDILFDDFLDSLMLDFEVMGM
jgi:hypothetical protein